ncbi:MAG: pilus assembly protein PilM [Gammaproteobacteria bacterium]
MSALADRFINTAWRANSTRIGPIGLDFSLTEVHLVQLQFDINNRITLRASTSLPYSGTREELLAAPKKLRSLLQQALKAEHFRGKAVVTTLPASDTRIMAVSYQAGEGQSDDAALLYSLAERVDHDLNDYVIDYLPVRAATSSADRLAIVTLARRETVIGYLEVLRKAGLEIRQLEIGPVAIRRLVSSMGAQDKHENVLAINFGRTASYITVVSGNRLLLDQEIHCGETGLLENIAGELDMSVESVRVLLENNNISPQPPAAVAGSSEIDIAGTLQEIIKPLLRGLTEEINRVLVYTASQTHGEVISRIYMMGSLARWQGMDGLLNSLIKLPVETIPDPLKSFGNANTSPAGRQPRPEIAVATGLALNGFDEDV